MLALQETGRAAQRPRRDPQREFASRLRRIFREYPGAIVVRAERHHDPRLCPRNFCAAQGIVPLVSHQEDGVSETALSCSVYEAYIRHLSRLAAALGESWACLPTAFWADPDRCGGYCLMPISLAA